MDSAEEGMAASATRGEAEVAGFVVGMTEMVAIEGVTVVVVEGMVVVVVVEKTRLVVVVVVVQSSRGRGGRGAAGV